MNIITQCVTNVYRCLHGSYLMTKAKISFYLFQKINSPFATLEYNLPLPSKTNYLRCQLGMKLKNDTIPCLSRHCEMVPHLVYSHSDLPYYFLACSTILH